MKLLKNSYFQLTLLIVAALAFKFVFKRNSVEIPKYGTYLSCVGTPADIKVKHKSELYLIEAALPKSKEEQQALFHQAAWYQNTYTFSNLTDINKNSTLKWSSNSYHEPKIKILNDYPAEYKSSLSFKESSFKKDLDKTWFPPEAKAYLYRVSKIENIKKGMPARRVEYEYETNIYTCFTSKDTSDFGKLKFFQPIDPYLAYHEVPESQYIFLKNDGRKASGVFNPCIRPNAINYNGFNAFAFFAFWQPEAQGHGSNKEPFDCSLFYKEGESIQKVNVTYEEATPVERQFIDFGHFDKLNRPIKTAFLFGSQESDIFEKFDIPQSTKLIELYLSGIPTSEARKSLPSFQEKFDPNFSRLLLLLWNITKNMDIIHKNIDVKEDHLKVVLKGKLKLSKKDLELTFYFSPNNPRLDTARYFDQAAKESLLTNDIVIYEGHSAGGEVFNNSLNEMRAENYPLQDKKIEYQVMALLSCSSTLFFDPHNFPPIQNPKFKRDVIATGGGYLDHMGNGSLALIASLDGYLYNESYVPFGFWAKNFKSDNFYILSNLRYQQNSTP